MPTELFNKPTVVVDNQKALANIERMAGKCRQSNCDFRPHFKTHQSKDVGEWFRDFGIEKIAVSSLDMADYFARNGWKNISVCVPVNVLQMELINRLAKEISLHLLVEAFEALDRLAKSLQHKVNIWIEVDTGYHRSGVDFQRFELIGQMIQKLSNAAQMDFQGILTHDGHTYKARGKQEILAVHNDSLKKLVELKNKMEAEIGTPCAISIGDTPACSVLESFSSEIAEVRPGNFIFYDLMQTVIGSCLPNDIALALLCPVIAKHPERGEFILYGGAVHLSKEVTTLKNGTPCFGLVASLEEKGWSQPLELTYVSELSQEHGKVKAPAEFIKQLKIGEQLAVLPVHSCLTADLRGKFYTTEGILLERFRFD